MCTGSHHLLLEVSRTCTRQPLRDAALQSRLSEFLTKETLNEYIGCVLRAPVRLGNLILGPKLLVEEVVGWKWLQHENILPFIGVTLAPPLFSIISEWMENGDIMHFTRIHPEYNRLHLVCNSKMSKILPC